MNKYIVTLYSKVSGDTTAYISFFVNTPMSEKQLKSFYRYKSLSISNVEVSLVC
jgi:hypothetical protein